MLKSIHYGMLSVFVTSSFSSPFAFKGSDEI